MLKACLYRGGTSKGLIVLKEDVEESYPSIEDFKKDLPRLFGSDAYGSQINGIGAVTSVTNKAAIVWIAKDSIHYKFFQVECNTSVVSDNLTCGNLIAAVIPFLLHKNRIIADVKNGYISNTVHDVNTNQYVKIKTEVVNGQYASYGNTSITGIVGSYPQLVMQYQDMYGACLRDKPLVLTVDINIDDEFITCFVVDSATLAIIAKVEHLSYVKEDEMVQLAAKIRESILPLLVQRYQFNPNVIPKVLFYKNVELYDSKVCAEVAYFTPGTLHHSVAVSGGIAFITALFIDNGIFNELKTIFFDKVITVDLKTKTGIVSFTANINSSISISIIRTARLIFDGYIY